MKLNVLKPSVNNMAVRVFMRTAHLDFTEDDVYGKTRTADFLAKNPAHLDADAGNNRIAEGWPVGELCHHAVPVQQARHQQILSEERRAARHDRQRHVYIIGTLYPLVARATYPALGFPQYPGEVGASDADASAKTTAQKAAIAAIAEPLDVFHKFYMDGKPFIGGTTPTIADIRLAATLEFLAAVDYPLPSWAKNYTAAMESSLGKAYSEPAADVRGYIAYVKSQKK